MDLKSQVALVTGAGRGIGRAISLALSAAGAHVVAASRNHEHLKQLVHDIEAVGGSATAIPTNLAEEADILSLFRQVDKDFGRLDILINNAGIGRFGPVVDFATADFDQVMQVNLRGTFICSREALKLMIPRQAGYVINIASVVGFKGYPNQAAYTASKHGIMGLTKSLAAESQQHGIRVSAILPGGVDTEMVAEARPDLDRSVLIRPEDIASTVIYMLSLSEQAAVDQVYIRRRSSAPF
jgi:3-oxoacyl-[acyl-carrier protein] reductase